MRLNAGKSTPPLLHAKTANAKGRLSRRSLLALTAAALASACAQPLLEENAAVRYQVTELDVDVSKLDGVTGRENAIPVDQVQRDIYEAVLIQLREGGVGDTPVKVSLVIDTVGLISPGQALFVGGISSIQGTVSLADASSGAVILAPRAVRGNSETGYLLGGLIGAAAAASKSPEADYRATVAGFAADVRKRLFGAPLDT